jgi:hypothetical protein
VEDLPSVGNATPTRSTNTHSLIVQKILIAGTRMVNTKDKEEGWNLDRVPPDLPAQFGQAGMLHRGSILMATRVATTGLMRKGGTLAARRRAWNKGRFSR